MEFCPAPPEAGMVGGIIETVDCHIRVLVHDSYRELVGPNTWFAAAFTGMLTIYIALLGYQLLFGRGGLRVTELPFTVLKIGLILAFLTSWAAYQTLIFNLLFDGPAEVMEVLLSPLKAQGAAFDGNVMGGLEETFQSISGAAEVYGGMSNPAANILQGGPMLGSGLLWLSSIVLLLSILGLIIAAKVVLAFLLAVGPIFIGCFLFDGTRGLFDGWFRATLSFALAPLAVTVFGAVSLMILQPFVTLLVANANANVFDMGPVITIGLIVTVFSVVMLFGLGAVASIANGFRSQQKREEPPAQPRMMALPAPEGSASDRAEQIAARIATIDRGRDRDTSFAFREAYSTRRTGEVVDAVALSASAPAGRLGQAYSRSPRPVTRPGEDA